MDKKFKCSQHNCRLMKYNLTKKYSDSNDLLTIEYPISLKSKFYNIQNILGMIGCSTFLIGIVKPILLIPSFLLIYSSYAWRKLSDPFHMHFKRAKLLYKKKEFDKCIQLFYEHFKNMPNECTLNLMKADCYNNLEIFDMAYDTYKNFFQSSDIFATKQREFLNQKTDAIELFIENQNFDLALRVIQYLPDIQVENLDLFVWKNFTKGLCFMHRRDYDLSLQAFKDALGKTRDLTYPYLDCHYYMGIIYTKLDKQELAQNKFKKIYDFDPEYKNVSTIIDMIRKDKELSFKV